MFSLRIKFFLAMLLASSLLIAGLLGSMQWSFTRGFGEYLQLQQQQRLATIADELASHYAETGSLENIDPDRLRYLHIRALRSPAGERRHPPPHRSRPPLFILGTDQQVLFGHFNPVHQHAILPVQLDGQLIGYVGEPVRTGPQDFMEQQFARHQSSHLLLFALFAALTSLLVAWPLASLLVRRIRLLLQHIEQLSKGEFAARTVSKSNDELSLLSVHLNALGQTLQQNAQSHRALVADISHELRTPIGALKAQLEAIEDGVQPMTDTVMQRLQQQVGRLAGLVDDLYQLSLADLGALKYTKEILDLRPLVIELASGFSAKIQQAGLHLEIRNLNTRKLEILGDAQRLQQLFANLLQNSVQYTNAPGSIVIELGSEGDSALVRVLDSSPGVPAELQTRLFERLFRVDASRNRNTGGAGLGLSLCQSICQAHGGSIEAGDSELGGLAVTLKIPLVSPQGGRE